MKDTPLISQWQVPAAPIGAPPGQHVPAAYPPTHPMPGFYPHPWPAEPLPEAALHARLDRAILSLESIAASLQGMAQAMTPASLATEAPAPDQPSGPVLAAIQERDI